MVLLRTDPLLRAKIMAMSEDLRVILVKLADRLHNMRTLGFHGSAEKRQTIANETRILYGGPVTETNTVQLIKL